MKKIFLVDLIKGLLLTFKYQAPSKNYTEQYFNCVISDFTDGETITIGTMQIYKRITINYTHYIRT